MEINAAVAALLGALIGAASSLLTIVIQQRYQSKRELLKIAADLALEDHKQRCEAVASIGGKMPPVSTYVHYHLRVLEHMAAGTYSKDTVQKLAEESDQIISAYLEVSQARQARASSRSPTKE